MESDSESEEFFDAQDVTPQNISSVPSSPRNLGKEVKANSNSHSGKLDEPPAVIVDDVARLFKSASNDNFPKVEINREENEKRYQKFKELRKKIETEEDEVINNSPSGSQTSSVDGIHATIGPRIYHPFRVLDYDSTSVQSGISLGRVGRILSGGDTFSVNEASELNTANSETTCIATVDDPPEHQDASEDSNPNSEAPSAIFQEPDVVASTKQEKPGLFPVPPPRHKRRSKLKGSDLSI